MLRGKEVELEPAEETKQGRQVSSENALAMAAA